MKPIDPVKLVQHLGGVSKASRALGISRPAIYKWLEKGRIPERTEPFVRLVVPDYDE